MRKRHGDQMHGGQFYCRGWFQSLCATCLRSNSASHSRCIAYNWASWSGVNGYPRGFIPRARNSSHTRSRSARLAVRDRVDRKSTKDLYHMPIPSRPAILVITSMRAVPDVLRR